MADSSSSVDRQELPPNPVVLYIERCSARLDGHRFAATGLAGDAKEIHDVRTKHMYYIAVGAWRKR